jgi:hypothetical protein
MTDNESQYEYHRREAMERIDGELVGPAEMAVAQVHATLAVAAAPLHKGEVDEHVDRLIYQQSEQEG